tara:strand:+ start:2276 stop:2962 length:687 start_codon:yes stop_codon:yes gene_type:complete
MKILVFDTETTGLPQKNEDGKEPSIYDFDKWPYIIQISYILYDLSTNDTIIKNNYIKIDNSIIIPPESFEKHKLTHEILNTNGINIIPALREFNNLLKIADVIVAHNISFDKRLIFVECLRHKIPQYFTSFKGDKKIRKSEFCTMKKTTKHCNIIKISKKTNKPYVKTPSLSELYLHLFPDSILPTELHNSLVDILITLKCYIKFNYNYNITDVNDKIKELCMQYNCI